MKRTAPALIVLLFGGSLAGACRGAPPQVSDAEDALRRDVRAFWARQSAATDARMRRDWAAASTFYEEALALDPRHEDALYYLGQCRREQGMPADARTAFLRLVEVNPQSARAHLALGSLLASPDPAEPIDLRAAESHLRRAHEINGEETGPVVRLGEVLLVMGREDEAAQWLESALRSNPRCVEAAFLGAFVAWERGSQDVARLVHRVRAAAKVEAPVKGVLSEGDRMDARRAVAPPLARPLGVLLFGGPITTLRSRAAAGEEIPHALVVELFREVRRVRMSLATRSESLAQPATGHDPPAVAIPPSAVSVR